MRCEIISNIFEGRIVHPAYRLPLSSFSSAVSRTSRRHRRATSRVRGPDVPHRRRSRNLTNRSCRATLPRGASGNAVASKAVWSFPRSRSYSIRWKPTSASVNRSFSVPASFRWIKSSRYGSFAVSLSRTRFASTTPVCIRWMPVSSTRYTYSSGLTCGGFSFSKSFHCVSAKPR